MSLEWRLLSPSIDVSVLPAFPDQTQVSSVSISQVRPFRQVAPRQGAEPGAAGAGRGSGKRFCVLAGATGLTVLTALIIRERAVGEDLALEHPARGFREEQLPLYVAPSQVLNLDLSPFLPLPHLQGTWGGFRASPELPSDAATSSPRSRAADPDLSNPDTSGPGG